MISGLDRAFTPEESTQRLAGRASRSRGGEPRQFGRAAGEPAGQVIGIIAALVNPTEQDVFIGIGFAVPIDLAGGGRHAGVLTRQQRRLRRTGWNKNQTPDRPSRWSKC